MAREMARGMALETVPGTVMVGVAVRAVVQAR